MPQQRGSVSFPAQGLADRAKIAHQQGLLPSTRSRWRKASRLVQLAHWLRDEPLGGREVARVAKYEAWMRQDRHEGGRGALDWPGERRVAPADFSRYLDETVGLVRSLGARPVLVSMPRQKAFEDRTPIALEYTAQVLAAAERLDVPCVDGRHLFKGDPVTRPNPLALYLDHFHPSAEGHRLLADALTPIVRAALAERGD